MKILLIRRMCKILYVIIKVIAHFLMIILMVTTFLSRCIQYPRPRVKPTARERDRIDNQYLEKLDPFSYRKLLFAETPSRCLIRARTILYACVMGRAIDILASRHHNPMHAVSRRRSIFATLHTQYARFDTRDFEAYHERERERDDF